MDGEVGKEWFRIPFIVNVSTGVSWMNSAYAEANYSVNYETDRFNLFKAKSGMHDVHVATRVTMMFSERLGTIFMGKGTYLLGDAADSPLTQNTFQPSGKNVSLLPLLIKTNKTMIKTRNLTKIFTTERR